jgi:hypothetical protein
MRLYVVEELDDEARRVFHLFLKNGIHGLTLVMILIGGAAGCNLCLSNLYIMAVALLLGCTCYFAVDETLTMMYADSVSNHECLREEWILKNLTELKKREKNVKLFEAYGVNEGDAELAVEFLSQYPQCMDKLLVHKALGDNALSRSRPHSLPHCAFAGLHAGVGVLTCGAAPFIAYILLESTTMDLTSLFMQSFVSSSIVAFGLGMCKSIFLQRSSWAVGICTLASGIMATVASYSGGWWMMSYLDSMAGTANGVVNDTIGHSHSNS